LIHAFAVGQGGGAEWGIVADRDLGVGCAAIGREHAHLVGIGWSDDKLYVTALGRSGFQRTRPGNIIGWVLDALDAGSCRRCPSPGWRRAGVEILLVILAVDRTLYW